MENFNTIENLKKYKHIHMLGIGGISMSGIAEILHHWGFFVTGSDCTRTKITDRLSSHGIYVSIGQSNLIDNADLVIYSAAIKENDPELVIAKAKGIHSIERCDFVGFLTRIFNDTIGISGTHGKTTTTSMVSLCFMEAGFDPTIQVGAILNDINGNYRVGNSDYFILEACEYVESFLKFSPKSAIILNIDNDHLDYFKDFEHIKSAFSKYVDLLPREGLLVINGDDESCLELRKSTSAKTITYGINNEKANFVARNITVNDFGCHRFDVYYNNRFYSEIKLSVPGIHNVSNALACIALCNAYGISKGDIKYALSKFKGASRRFEYVGSYNNIDVYDDYAHHPQEIKATSEALKNKKHRQSWVVFQPHTYSRTVSLLKDFAQSLLDFDNIIITDIYAAREKNIYNISSQDLVSEIKKLGKNSIYISSFEDITRYIKERACPNDIVLTMGAGTVVDISKMLLN
ncbi:MAG: UDP-N-acetylmuramate--L-alanine ligase [Clostridiales bacterium]|nr:UDP-N-acetylmuramate--L-alanine ligase [Clostridiales bacterium]